MRPVVICLCDLTGTFAAPWVAAGYDAILVDPQHAAGVHVDGPVTRVGAIIDAPETWALLRKVIAGRTVAFVACFPPCTDLAVSGARWFAEKRASDPSVQFKAMQVVWQCHVIAELCGAPYFIENPVSQISSFWRKPDHTFHPYEFTGYAPEDNYTKKTCLWTGGGSECRRPCVRQVCQNQTTASTRHRRVKGAPISDRPLRAVSPSRCFSKMQLPSSADNQLQREKTT